MLGAIHYLVHGTWLGVLALILIIFGLTTISFAQISIHRNSNSSSNDASLSHRLFGSAFILAGILVVLLTLFFGYQPINAKEYALLYQESRDIPEIKPALQTFIATHPDMTRIDFYTWEVEFDDLKKQLYTQKVTN